MHFLFICLRRFSSKSDTDYKFPLFFLQALDAFQVALKYNAKSSEVSRKIKRLMQLAKDKKRAEEVETMRSNVDMTKHLDSFKTELVGPSFHMFYLFRKIYSVASTLLCNQYPVCYEMNHELSVYHDFSFKFGASAILFKYASAHTGYGFLTFFFNTSIFLGYLW